jgi:methane monooxygenase component A beta chain/propane monooxygenase small subunit
MNAAGHEAAPGTRAIGSRTFTWFKPQGRRPTEYELYTVGQQSTPQEWLRVGWPLRFDDGRDPYTEASTEVRSSRWRDWRDPHQVWQRPYVQASNYEEQALDRLIPAALAEGGLSSINQCWLHEAVAKYYAAWPYTEYGLFLSLCYAVREALADTVMFALAYEATDKLRHQQDVVRLLLDLGDLDETFSDGSARDAWMSDPALVPIRENIERIFSLNDWGEVVIAINLAFEPLVGALVKDEFLARNASYNGDPVTSMILAAARRDTGRHLATTSSLVRFLTSDPEFGPANRDVIAEWVRRWAGESTAVSQAAAGLFQIGGITVVNDAQSALARVTAAQSALAGELGLG